MTTILTGKSLPRRTLLKGLGASLALPFLDSMFPAFGLRGQAAPEPVHRFQAFYVPNGMAMEYWSPTGEGRDFEPHTDPRAPGALPGSDAGSLGNQSELGPDPRRCFGIVPDRHSSGRADRD